MWFFSQSEFACGFSLGDCDAERFGRGQIDNKIELGGLFG
jgi:hypothetical protein